MVIRFNIPGAGLVSTDTQLMPVNGASSRPTPRAAAPAAQAFAREVVGGTDVPHAVPAVAPPSNFDANVDNGTVVQQEPPAWLDEAPVSHQDGDDGAAHWGGDFGDHAPVAPRRRAESRANPRDFAPEPTLRFHNGAPEDIPLGSTFTEREWAAVRTGADVRATAVEIDLGGGRALISASWDEPGSEVLSVLGVERLRLVSPEASAHPERAALGRVALMAESTWAGRSILDRGLPVGTIKIGNALVDDSSGEVLGEAPVSEQGRLEMERAARDAGAELLLFTTPRDWLALRGQLYQEREQAWYDDRQAWPRHTPVAIIHRPLVLIGGETELICSQVDWLAAGESNLGVIGPARSGARWTEGEAQAVMRWLEVERNRPENAGLDEVEKIRLEDVAIMKLVEERSRPAPAATALIECLGRQPGWQDQRETEHAVGRSAPDYDRPRH
ncbi:MAG: hypothetical protein E2591_26975 [Achromobacter sp.]|uniref:hypothetical protein n=1 Tax=Achromobacter sp. TaxID=134375 RepID=UPI0012C79EDF|nr:hypothetical protein [Achromobacter sp.]MPS81721.1 hypothetical protein [Achromobacter sp.]